MTTPASPQPLPTTLCEIADELDVSAREFAPRVVFEMIAQRIRYVAAEAEAESRRVPSPTAPTRPTIEQVCNQCGQPFAAPACGPTHAMIAFDRMEKPKQAATSTSQEEDREL